MLVWVPEVRCSIQIWKNHYFSTKMSFNFADAHCNVNIHNCLDSGSFGDTFYALLAQGFRFTTHSQTSRSKKAAPRRDNVALSLRAFDIPLVFQCNSLRIGPFQHPSKRVCGRGLASAQRYDSPKNSFFSKKTFLFLFFAFGGIL